MARCPIPLALVSTSIQKRWPVASTWSWATRPYRSAVERVRECVRTNWSAAEALVRRWSAAEILGPPIAATIPITDITMMLSIMVKPRRFVAGILTPLLMEGRLTAVLVGKDCFLVAKRHLLTYRLRGES